MQARVVTEIDLENSLVRRVEQVDGRFFVATENAVLACEGAALVPVLEAPRIFDMQGPLVLTPQHIFELGGAPRPLPPLGNAEPAAFVPLLDGAVVAVHDRTDSTAAAVLRLGRAGKLRWRAPLPAPRFTPDHGRVPRGNGVGPLRHRDHLVTWIMWGPDLCMSRDRVLAVYADGFGMGIGYGLDLETGGLVYTTPPGPYGELAEAPVDLAGPGAFFIGWQGYGRFETSLVDREGRSVTRWQSHGIVLPGEPVRVIERENQLPSRRRVATLHRDGTVEHGAHLPEYYTSSAVIASDGSAVFCGDSALLRVSPDGGQLERLVETLAPSGALSSLAGRAPGRVALAWSTWRDGGWHSRFLVVELEL